MTKQVLISLLAAASLLSADSLIFRNGSRIDGKFVGGDDRSVRFVVGNQVNTYSVNDVDSVRFWNSPSAAPAAQSNAYPPAGSYPPANTYPLPSNAGSQAGAYPPGPPPSQTNPYPQTNSYPSPNVSQAGGGPLPQPAPDLSVGAQNGPPPVNSSSGAPPNGMSIPAGTPVVVRLIDPVNSDQDSLGQTFRTSVDQPVVVNGQTVIPRGADAVATLIDSQQSGKIEGRTVLTLDLKTVTVNNQTYNIVTTGTAQASGSRGKRSAEVIGGTAALGAIIGAVAGGGKGAAIGAGSGAAVGTAGQVLTSGQKVKIPAETRLTFTLQNPLTL